MIESVDTKGNRLSQEQIKFFSDSKIVSKKRLIVAYHGSSSSFSTFTGEINWFTSSKSYASEYSLGSGIIYECYLNCKSLFHAGGTDGRIFLPVTKEGTEPPLTAEATELMSNLGLPKSEFRKLVDASCLEYGYEGTEVFDRHLNIITRSSAFAKLMVSEGYDCIFTKEEGHLCFGVLDSSEIKSISNKNPTSGNNINEEYYPKNMKYFKEHTVQDLIDFTEESIGTSDKPVDGPSYIMPDGKFLTIWRSKIPVSKYSKTGSATHRDVQDFLFRNGWTEDDAWVDNLILEELVNCIRVNSGFEEYIWLPDNKPNEAQFNSLIEWLDWYFEFHHKIMVGFKTYALKTYSDSDYTVDEIMNKIRKAYAVGYLDESVK